MAESEEIGTVISGMNGPSPSSVDFVVTKGVVHRGQFVELDYSEGKLVALVVDVFKTNRYFERAEAVKEFESSGRKLLESFPTAEWEYLVAQTRPLGIYVGNTTKRPTYPPSPGTKVKVAEAESLRKFLGLQEDGLHLGEVEYHSLPVKLNMSRLLKKHLAILAMSGAGKSVATKVIIEELLKRKTEQGRIGIVVMDAHGEYTSFAQPAKKGQKDFSSQTKIVKARDVKIGVPKLSLGLIASIISGLSGPQKRELEKILNSLRGEMKGGSGPFDLNAVKGEILGSDDMNEKTKSVLLSWIASLEELGLFSKTDLPSITDLVKPGQLTVVDLSDVVNMKKKQIIVSYFSQKLFTERMAKKVPPFMLIIEEAHQFAPAITREESSISRRIIETIAREGRKFGASLCLISQRPVNLSTTALANCNTHLILRVTNPYDLKHIGESSEGIDAKSQDMITSLRVGEGLLVGEAVNYPVFFRIRKNESPDSVHEQTLEEAAVAFEKGEEESEKETEHFL